MTFLSNQKEVLRNSVLAKRNTLETDQRIGLSLDATQHGRTVPALQSDKLISGTVVAGFHPIRSEIDPRPLMFELAKRGARLCLPVVIDKQTIVFRELVRGAPLVEGSFGTVGPDENAAVLDPETLLIPLSVYDNKGGRIGYGGGYYDRAIAKLIDKGIEPNLLGIAFSLQEADEVPMESHDRYLNGIITEKGFVSFSS